MSIALCTLAKQENRYLREFVEHYEKIGFDKIFICDNNNPDGERIEDAIDDYIKSGFVSVIDRRGAVAPQVEALNFMYNDLSETEKFDYIAMFDCDEFLTLPRHNSVKDFLSDLNTPLSKYHFVLINWMFMTDNDLVRYDNRPLAERFPHAMYPYEKDIPYHGKWGQNRHVKTIAHSRRFFNHLKIVWDKIHQPSAIFLPFGKRLRPLAIRPNGQVVKASSQLPLEYSTAYLKHYYTKTIEEFVNVKLMRGDVAYPGGIHPNPQAALKVFFSINNKTQEKLDYLKSIGIESPEDLVAKVLNKSSS